MICKELFKHNDIYQKMHGNNDFDLGKFQKHIKILYRIIPYNYD